MAEAISLSFTAELGALRRQLAAAGDLTENQIRRLTISLEREQQRQTAALRRISTAGARETERAAREAEQAVESRRRGIQQIAALALGDSVNDLGDLREGLTDVGVAAEGAGVAVAALVGIGGGLYLTAKAIDLTAGSAFRLASGAQAAYEHLEKFKKIPGILPKIDRADLKAVNELPAALQAIGLLAESASLQIGAKLAPAFRSAAVAAVATGLAFNDFLEGALKAAGRLGQWYDELPYAAKVAVQAISPIPGLISSLESLGGSLADGTSAFGDYGKRADELVGSLAKMHDWEVRGAAAADKAAEAAKAAAEAEQARRDVLEGLAAVQAEAEAAGAGAAQQIQIQRAADIAQIEKLSESYADNAEVIAAAAAARLAVERRVAREIGQLRQQEEIERAAIAQAGREAQAEAVREHHDLMLQMESKNAENIAKLWKDRAGAVAPYADAILSALSAVDQLAARQIDQHEAELERLRAQRAEWREVVRAKVKAYRSGRADMEEADRAAAEAEIKRLRDLQERSTDAIQAQIRDQKKAARAAWAIQKAAAVSQAVIQAGLAVLQVMASVPAPAWPVAIPAAISAGALQVGLIAAEPPPKFHTGRAPDETPATLTRGEAVLTPRAVAAMGGADAVRAANRGEMDGGGGGGGTVVVALNDRVIDVAMARTLRVGRAVRVELRRLGRSPGGRGGYR